MKRTPIIAGILGIAGIGASLALLGGGPTLVSRPAQCDQAELHDVYDTPSGTLETGYYDASSTKPDMSTTTYKMATKIGRQAYMLCHTEKQVEYFVPITQKEWDDLGKRDAKFPQKSVMETP